MHEVVTLQFGQQANYVGTHFWNTQESYFTYGAEEESPVDHDIHFRPGVGEDGSETFTPRTVIYDLKGAFGTLKRENALYGSQEDPSGISQQMWNGSTNVIRNDPIPQSTYQQHLDQGLSPPTLTTDSVRFWSDYNRVFYHPRSIVQLHEYEVNSALMPFERWSTGEDLFDSLDKEHDLLDRDLRPFLEECDQMQAIQMITSTDDAWGGFAAKYLERIRDDLGKTSAWVWGLEEGGRYSRQKQMLQTANTAQSIYNIASQASLYVPLTTLPSSLPSYIHLDGTSRWHTSAMQMLALESITLPTRLKATQSGRASYDEIEGVLSNNGNRRIAALSFSAVNLDDHDTAANGTDHRDGSTNGHANGGGEDEETDTPQLDIDMQPETASPGAQRGARRPGTHVFSQIQSLRGLWKSTIEIEDANRASRNRFSQGPRIQRFSPPTIHLRDIVCTDIRSHQSSLLFPVLDSFPHVFDFGTGSHDKVAVRSALSASTAVAQRVRNLESLARSLVGIDEREALCDGLSSIVGEYQEGWESGSESDDDDA